MLLQEISVIILPCACATSFSIKGNSVLTLILAKGSILSSKSKSRKIFLYRKHPAASKEVRFAKHNDK